MSISSNQVTFEQVVPNEERRPMSTSIGKTPPGPGKSGAGADRSTTGRPHHAGGASRPSGIRQWRLRSSRHSEIARAVSAAEAKVWFSQAESDYRTAAALSTRPSDMFADPTVPLLPFNKFIFPCAAFSHLPFFCQRRCVVVLRRKGTNARRSGKKSDGENT